MTATTNPAATAEKKPTAKSKEALAPDLGLSPAQIAGMSITWVPFALSPADAETLTLVAKAKQQKVFVAPAKALAAWLEAERKALETEANAVRIADDRTEEEIAKELESAKKKLETLAAKLEEAKKNKG